MWESMFVLRVCAMVTSTNTPHGQKTRQALSRGADPRHCTISVRQALLQPRHAESIRYDYRAPYSGRVCCCHDVSRTV